MSIETEIEELQKQRDAELKALKFTASRTKRTFSGIATSAVIRHVPTSPAENGVPGAKGGTGRPSSNADCRSAMNASTISGVASGSASRTSREATAVLIPGTRE